MVKEYSSSKITTRGSPTSKNKNILWHIFLILPAEQTHAFIDNGLL